MASKPEGLKQAGKPVAVGVGANRHDDFFQGGDRQGLNSQHKLCFLAVSNCVGVKGHYGQRLFTKREHEITKCERLSARRVKFRYKRASAAGSADDAHTMSVS